MRNIDFFPSFRHLSNRVTGFASAKVGRMAAFTIGGAIILLEIANEQGIIKIDWNRLTRKADQVGDKVQKAVTGEGPKWMEKVIFLKVFFSSREYTCTHSLMAPKYCNLGSDENLSENLGNKLPADGP